MSDAPAGFKTERQQATDYELNPSLVNDRGRGVGSPRRSLSIFCNGPMANSRFPFEERLPCQTASGVHGDITMHAHTRLGTGSIGSIGNHSHEMTGVRAKVGL